MASVAVPPPPSLLAPIPQVKLAFSEADTHAHDVSLDSDSPSSSSSTSPALSRASSSDASSASLDGLVATNDPHHLPIFDETSLTAPTSPILYLPPLLSSLPHGFQHSFPNELDRHRRPLNTETRLPDIDPASLALHKVLHHFQPVNQDYAETPYDQAFNWSEMQLPLESEREWYCVVFRSKRKDGSDSGPLYEADRSAHEEAVQNGGLILYWYGIPNPVTGLNLATCIWQSRQHAIAANSRPHHVRAMRLAAASYERYELNRYRLSKRKGETTLKITPFDSGDVGW